MRFLLSIPRGKTRPAFVVLGPRSGDEPAPSVCWGEVEAGLAGPFLTIAGGEMPGDGTETAILRAAEALEFRGSRAAVERWQRALASRLG